MTNQRDKQVIRELAKQYMEIAQSPVMKEREQAWRDVKDLKMSRPVVLAEVSYIQNFIRPEEMQCSQEIAWVEKQLRVAIRHSQIGDDVILKPFWGTWPVIEKSNYGVDIEQIHSKSSDGSEIGYAFESPIKTPDDFSKLKERTFNVNREATQKEQDLFSDLFGDAMPVVATGVNTHLISMTRDLFTMLGAENFLVWLYEYTDEYRWLVDYMRKDRISYYKFLEEQNLLGYGNISSPVGSGSYGLVSDLKTDKNRFGLKDAWVWTESQESEGISPEHFAEFFLPALTDISKLFGLTYYGCCERLDDRWDSIEKAIHNIRAVSISPWSNLEIMGEKLGKNYVFSRKPNPTYISGANPEWDLLRQDLQNTVNAAKNCNFEIVFRDIYNESVTVESLKKWTEMARTVAEG